MGFEDELKYSPDEHYKQWMDCKHSRKSSRDHFWAWVKDEEVKICQYPCPDFVCERDEEM